MNFSASLIFFWEVNSSSENHHNFLFLVLEKSSGKYLCSSHEKSFCIFKKDWTYKNLHIQKILKKFCAKFFFGFSLSFLFF